MNSQNHFPEEELAGLMDGLVCGDLDDGPRGRVLAWLEEDPARWRLCGLAFLEAQTWSQSLGQWPGVEPLRDKASDKPATSASQPPVGSDVFDPPATDPTPVHVLSKPPSQRQTTARRTLTAAALLVAFGLGLALRDAVVPPKSSRHGPVADNGSSTRSAAATTAGTSDGAVGDEPVLAALDVRTGDGFGPTAPIHIPVVPVRAAAGQGPVDRRGTEISEYVRQQWERRGYKVSLERRFLFARLPDGQQVAVPVEQVHVNPLPVSFN